MKFFLNEMKIINLKKISDTVKDYYKPVIIAELNDQEVKLAKLKGEFVRHKHENEDEMFYVLKGKITIDFEDKKVDLNEGEMLVIPKGTEHKPYAENEAVILLFEPANVLNTGNVINEMTVKNPEKM